MGHGTSPHHHNHHASTLAWPGLESGRAGGRDPVPAPSRASLASSLTPWPHKLLTRQLGPEDRVGGG